MDKLEGQKRHLDFSQTSGWSQALYIIKTLQNQGYEAVLAGGAVRDALLESEHLKKADLDIATSAHPDEVEALFPKTVAVGKAFGVIRVLHEGHSFEVATFRKDGLYVDGRRPEKVDYSSLLEDAQRRDFTINALFYDPINHLLFDGVRGEIDLKNKILRAVGEPLQRMQEDQLRRLRCVRFASQLGFAIEKDTLSALSVDVEKLSSVSSERITQELEKMWLGPHLSMAAQVFYDSGMAAQIHSDWKKVPWPSPEHFTIERSSSLEAWLHYFLTLGQFQNLEKNLNRLRLSREMQIQIQAAAKAFFAARDFLKLRLGEQRKQLAKPGFKWVLDLSLKDNSDYQELIKKISKLGDLPVPLLTGEDVIRLTGVSGIKIGLILQEVYLLQ
ncbi:MAG: CCA tRNA nucleotidyltransferase, partial [Bdellovibrionales bacterium]